MKKLMLLISFIMIGVNLLGINEKAEMKKLILKIREESPKDFILIPQNGTGIYFEGENKINYKLVDAVDGITQESIFYGYPKYGEKTPSEEKNHLLKNLRMLKKLDKVIMTVNYTDNKYGKWRSRNLAKENNFLNYCPKDREVTEIMEHVFLKNNKDIVNLSDAKNFLYLLNPEKFKHKSEYIDKLSQTAYDVLIIDLYFKGIELKKDDVNKLKIKPQGGHRLVIGYFSVGEAEKYRKYWREEWNDKLPKWISHENENWEGAYIVKYWSEEWQQIIEKMLKNHIESGFDGVFLDTIDTYQNFEEE
ncbi:MAG: endo alpha-1,4 polygalactosaminidase [Psychrilyobacter sp.]|uniref:endo alpha-1,4 polygalactosaminidase n=1 Tax=Psychrilyobacter sp. TaxID=2586924 RepID=UPI003C7254E1